MIDATQIELTFRLTKPTQKDAVLKYLQEHGSITQGKCTRDLGITRLAARINDLKKGGHNIKSEMISAPNRFGKATSIAKYFLCC